jgi:alpha-methylacyl-CoA racemase
MSATPLSGITVVDLSRLLPGPLAAHLLADLGARVIKVEEPRLGDPVRYAPPMVDEISALARLLLSGTESIALDLKRPAAREVLDILLHRADVLLDTFRPGTLVRLLEATPEELATRHPRLVQCSLSGWGATGPQAPRAGHDLSYQALAGTLAAIEGTAAAPPVPLADLVGAWSAVAAILAALVERGRTGRGTVIDASLFDAAVHSNLTNWAEETGGAREVGEPLPLTGELPCYRLYETADGRWIALAALEPHFWKRFCRAVDRKNLEARHLSTDAEARREVAELIRGRTRDEWRELFETEDLPAEPVLSAAEARHHPQTEARGVLFKEHGMPRVAFPARMDGERPRARRRFPKLGEHTDTLLAELGLDSGLKARLRRGPGVGKRFSVKRLLARWVRG